MAPTAHAPPGTNRPGLLICDQLDMLVTGDPIAELDAALTTAASHLHAARCRGDTRIAARLLYWINMRLDQRTSFTGG